jgi:hypothetical protein
MTARIVFLPSCELETTQGNLTVNLIFSQGSSGKSAYAAAREGGFTGSEAEFSACMAAVGGLDAVLDEMLKL